jgi:hypothetical protein
MKNQTNKTNQKGKAIASLVIGITGAFSLFLSWNEFLDTFIGRAIRGFSFLSYKRNFKWLSLFINCFYGACSSYSYLIASIFFALGIFLGVKSLKSSQRKIAILGIILCTIDLIGSLFTTYVWWWFLAR